MIAWRPTEEQKQNANITQFMKKERIDSLPALCTKSVQDPNWFYPAILDALHIKWTQDYTQVLDLSKGKQFPLWFKNGQTNLFLNCIGKHIDNGNGTNTAITWEGEDETVRNLTYDDVYKQANDLSAGLKKLGVEKGDRVGIFLPMIPETAVSLFACAKIGAILIPIFSGYGADSVATRLIDSAAKVLITANGYTRRKKHIDMKHVADKACQEAPSIQHVVVVENILVENETNIPWHRDRDHWYHDIAHNEHDTIPTEPMNSNDPFMMIYTSGTTGRPKATVHTHTGFPLKSALDMYLCFDVRSTDRVFWLTDIGWMMGPWLIIGATTLGANIVLYDGTPDYPHHDRLWKLIERHHISVFGLAPTVIRSLMSHGEDALKQYNLSTLRILGSTGEPWTPEAWHWFLENVGQNNAPIINYSGGTEISGGIIGCYPSHPLKPCSFTGPIPGIAVDVLNTQSESVRDTVGDLAIREPFVGMTQSLWQDDERYVETYWSRWGDIWEHGDWAKVDQDGFWYILGRSDDTINVAGKRLGASEMEASIASHPHVQEVASIGIPHKIKGEVPIVFVVLTDTNNRSNSLKQELLHYATERLGKALQPANLHFVEDLPRTRSNKVTRRLLKAKYLGQPIGDTSTLQNPEILVDIPTAEFS